MIVLQLLSNMLMLVPILVTGEIHDFISVEKFLINFSGKREQEAHSPPRQHWHLHRRGRRLQVADHSRLAAAHLCSNLCSPRSCLGLCLPQVASPMEDNFAKGKSEVSLCCKNKSIAKGTTDQRVQCPQQSNQFQIISQVIKIQLQNLKLTSNKKPDQSSASKDQKQF